MGNSMKRRVLLKTLQKRALRDGKKVVRTSPYARIDWGKAKDLFSRPLPKGEAEHKNPPVREILRVLMAVGALGMIFLFPGVGPAIGCIMLGDRKYPCDRTKFTLSRLARQKYVSIRENSDGTTTVTITKRGMVRALTYELDNLQIVKPKKWDKKWRVVVFDVPEKHKRLRDIFRVRLCQIGLYQLQESVYVSPYPCFDEVEFLRELYGVGFTTQYLLVERIEKDEFLRAHFGLSA